MNPLQQENGALGAALAANLANNPGNAVPPANVVAPVNVLPPPLVNNLGGNNEIPLIPNVVQPNVALQEDVLVIQDGGNVANIRDGADANGFAVVNPPPPNRAGVPIKFKVTKSKGKKLIKRLCRGVGKKTRERRGRYHVGFHGSISLKVPSMDDPVFQLLSAVKGSTASKGNIDGTEKSLYKVQSKLLEVFGPILYLAEQQGLADAHAAAVSDSLSLLSESFYEISNQRRQNILRQASPNFTYLLDEPENFDKKNMTGLFGRSFVEKLLSANSLKASLSSLGRGATDAIRGRNSNRGDQWQAGGGRGRYGNTPYADSYQMSPSGSHHDSNGAPGYSGNYQGGSQGGYGQPNSSQQHNSFGRGYNQQDAAAPGFDNQARYVINSVNVSQVPCLVGGRLAHFFPAWSDLTSDPWILDIISKGLCLEFSSEPLSRSGIPSPIHMSSEQVIIGREEVAAMLLKGAIVRAQPKGFVCSMFVIPKKTKGYRPIINLKPLNQFLVHHHFKWKGLLP